jgi:hypothetical protein
MWQAAKAKPAQLKEHLSKLDPAQKEFIRRAPEYERANLEKVLRNQAYNLNKKIMLWGGIPPVAATAAGIGATAAFSDNETSLDQIKKYIDGLKESES